TAASLKMQFMSNNAATSQNSVAESLNAAARKQEGATRRAGAGEARDGLPHRRYMHAGAPQGARIGSNQMIDAIQVAAMDAAANPAASPALQPQAAAVDVREFAQALDRAGGAAPARN